MKAWALATPAATTTVATEDHNILQCDADVQLSIDVGEEQLSNGGKKNSREDKVEAIYPVPVRPFS